MWRLAILLPTAFVLTTGDAKARDCGPRSAADAPWAHAIFMGEILYVELVGRDPGEMEVTFSVSRRWRGLVGERVTVRGPVDHILLLYFGEEFVIPVSRDDRGHLRSDWCSGIESLPHAGETLERLGEGRPPVKRTWTSSGSPSLEAPRAMTLGRAYSWISLGVLAGLLGWLGGTRTCTLRGRTVRCCMTDRSQDGGGGSSRAPN